MREPIAPSYPTALRLAFPTLLLLTLTACNPAWVEHKEKLQRYEAQGEWKGALVEARWMIDNALIEAPPEERGMAAEADRYLVLADMATRAGRTGEAIGALRKALITDPETAPDVRRRLAKLQLSPAERRQVQEEFSWNMAVMGTDHSGILEQQQAQEQCWSYTVREIRVRRERTVQAAGGRERHLSYDARPWSFDAETRAWSAAGAWRIDAGEEIELVAGPQQPRYRAVLAANGGFYVDSSVPPCHKSGWSGPYQSDGTVFVALQLPQTLTIDAE